MNKLTCPDCNYENEPERVYCHNCGIKLDRSLLPENQPQSGRGKKPAPLKSHRTRRLPIGAFIGKLIRIALGSAILAALILMALPPIVIPEVSDEARINPPMILMDLEEGRPAAGNRPRVYSEEQINAYLQGVIKAKSKPQGFIEENFQFGRVYSRLMPNEVLIGMSQGVFGYQLHAGTWMRVEIAGGDLTHEILDGYIGRLRIPQVIMRPLAPLMFGNVRNSLSQEIAALDKASSIVVEEKRAGVFYQTPGN